MSETAGRFFAGITKRIGVNGALERHAAPGFVGGKAMAGCLLFWTGTELYAACPYDCYPFSFLCMGNSAANSLWQGNGLREDCKAFPGGICPAMGMRSGSVDKKNCFF